MKYERVPEILLFVVPILFGFILSESSAEDLSRQAYRILEKHCYDCHGVDDNFDGLNVLKRDSLLKDRGENKAAFIKPGSPSESKVFTAIEDGRMPLSDEKLTKAELDVLRSWIDSGAEFPVASREQRPFKSERQILELIRNDLRAISSNETKRYVRYFSIAHLHNNPDISEKQLRYTRAALSKAVNSMSRTSRIILPRAIDPDSTIFAINLQDLGWDDTREYVWGEVLKRYPYGVQPTTDVDAFNMHEEIIDVIGRLFLDSIPYVRGDWFVDSATRPPLYHILTGIPKTLGELHEQLGIRPQQDFLAGRVVRGAVLKSGVSAQNRLMDRHPLDRGGAFWISYDFAANSGLSNIARFPLGPAFKENSYSEHAFREAGSEVVYELPNGLHGYMIVDAKGDRIDRAPVSIVWNKAQASFNPEVVNGQSCMGCHTHGIRDFSDILWDGHALNDGRAISFLRTIVPKGDALRENYINPDRVRYLNRLEEATGVFLKVAEDAGKEIATFPEPVTRVILEYSRPLTVTDAACEVGLEDVNRLKYAGLRKIGLGVLENGGVIQRTFWAPVAPTGSSENVDEFHRTSSSIFETVINHLDLGQPTKG